MQHEKNGTKILLKLAHGTGILLGHITQITSHNLGSVCHVQVSSCTLKKTDDIKLYAICCLVLFVYNLKTANRWS